MDQANSDRHGQRSPLLAVGAAVVDREGTVVRCSSTVADLLGRSQDDICGHPVQDLFAESPGTGRNSGAGQLPAEGVVTFRLGSGGTLDVDLRVLPLDGSPDEYVIIAAPADSSSDWRFGGAFLRALLAQDQMGIAIHDVDMNVIRTNIRTEIFEGPPIVPGIRLESVISAEDAEMIERLLGQVMETGVPFVRKRLEIHSSAVSGYQWDLSLSAFRLQDPDGAPSGIAVTVNDTTAQQRIRRQMDLQHQAAVRIGSSLDVVRTAQELADVLVPELGDLTAVDISDAVLVGDEPLNVIEGMPSHLVRVAISSGAKQWPPGLLEPGQSLSQPFGTVHIHQLQLGQALSLDREDMLKVLSSPLTRGASSPSERIP